MEISQNWGSLFAGPRYKDYCILGSILGSPDVRQQFKSIKSP